MKVSYPLIDNGNEYLLEVDTFNKALLVEAGINPTYEIYDVVLKRLSGCQKSSLGALSKLSSFLYGLLIDNPKAILYFFCDVRDVDRSVAHMRYSPQEYRSRLFSAMFEYESRQHPNAHWVNNQIIISTTEGSAYIHLITLQQNQDVVNQIKQIVIQQSKDDMNVV